MLFTLGKRICQMKMFMGLWVSVQWGPDSGNLTEDARGKS
jgi:hypothetical protein